MLPADSPEMIYGRLLVGQSPHHLNEAVKVLFLGRVLFHAPLMADKSDWVNYVYRSPI